MKILALVAEPPHPAESGYRIRCWEILRRLAERHEVRVVTRSLEPVSDAAWHATFDSVREVRGRGASPASLARSIVSRVPHHAALFAGDEMERAILEAARGADVIYAHYLYFARVLQALGPDRPALVLDQHNVDHETWESHASVARGPLRWWLARQAELVRRDERAFLPMFSAVLSVSEADARITRAIAGPAVRVVVAPNGADCSRLRPQPPREGGSTLLLTATSARRNVDGLAWFLRGAWPLVRRAVPSARLLVAGSLDPGRLPAALRRETGVTFTGHQESLEGAFSAADVAIVPIRLGGGTKLKTFEALASGLPVVAISPSAPDSCCTPNDGVLAENEPAAYAQAVIRLLQDDDLRRRLGAAGRRHAEAAHDWNRVARLVETVLTVASERAVEGDGPRNGGGNAAGEA